MFKKIISVIVLTAITISTLLISTAFLTLNSSAVEINGVAYQYKLEKNVRVNPKTVMGDSGDVSIRAYIQTSSGYSGYGYVGYSASAGSFYIQVDKYVVSGASWCLKYDSTGHWWYREMNMSEYKNYNLYSGDIYITLSDGELPSFLIACGIIKDTTQTIYFNDYRSDAAYPYDIVQTISNYVNMPAGQEREGYIFKGWSDGNNVYAPGTSVLVSNLNSLTLNPVYGVDSSIESNYKDYIIFYYGDEVYYYKSIKEIEESGSPLIKAPEVPNGDPNPDKLYWYGDGSYSTYISPGSNINIIHDPYRYNAVYGDKFSFYFPTQYGGDGVHLEFVTLGEKITMPEAKGYKEGCVFNGWTDGYLVYAPGQSYNVDSIKTRNLTAVFVPIGNGGNGGSDFGDSSNKENNFIVSFFSGVFDGLKENITPLLEDVTIPFLEVTLADVVSFLFWIGVGFLIFFLVIKLLGK